VCVGRQPFIRKAPEQLKRRSAAATLQRFGAFSSSPGARGVGLPSAVALAAALAPAAALARGGGPAAPFPLTEGGVSFAAVAVPPPAGRRRAAAAAERRTGHGEDCIRPWCPSAGRTAQTRTCWRFAALNDTILCSGAKHDSPSAGAAALPSSPLTLAFQCCTSCLHRQQEERGRV